MTATREPPPKLQKLIIRPYSINVQATTTANDAYTRLDVAAWLQVDTKTLRRWERLLRVYIRSFRHREEGLPLSDFQVWCLSALNHLLKPTKGANTDRIVAELINTNRSLFSRQNYASERLSQGTPNHPNQTPRGHAG